MGMVERPAGLHDFCTTPPSWSARGRGTSGATARCWPRRSSRPAPRRRSSPTRYRPIGIFICADMRSPELARLLALRGARVLFQPTNYFHRGRGRGRRGAAPLPGQARRPAGAGDGQRPAPGGRQRRAGGVRQQQPRPGPPPAGARAGTGARHAQGAAPRRRRGGRRGRERGRRGGPAGAVALRGPGAGDARRGRRRPPPPRAVREHRVAAPGAGQHRLPHPPPSTGDAGRGGPAGARADDPGERLGPGRHREDRAGPRAAPAPLATAPWPPGTGPPSTAWRLPSGPSASCQGRRRPPGWRRWSGSTTTSRRPCAGPSATSRRGRPCACPGRCGGSGGCGAA